MGDEFLGDRRRALEEAFFAKENDRLLQNLRQADAGKSGKDTLATVSGIADDALLGKLVALGVGSGALAASNSNWPDRRTGIIVRVEPRHGAAVLNQSESA
jgi:hypothetical protein